MISKLLKNRTVHNAGWLIGGKIVQMMVNLIVGLLMARYLGPANYGLINYAAAYIGFFAAFCVLGINSVLVKELIDHPDKEGEILGTSLVMKGISSILSALVILCVVYVADKGDPVVMYVTAFSCIGMLFNVFDVFNFWFQSKLQSKVTALVTLCAYMITACYKLFLMASAKSVVWFALSTSVDHICVAALLLWVYRKNGGQALAFSINTGREILSKSYHFILPSLMISVYAQTDKIMLKQMISSAEIGYYATAVSLCSVWCFVLSAIIDSMYPEIAKAHKTDEKLFRRRNKQLYAMVFYISVFVSALITIFGGFAVKIMYGQAYMPAVAPLRIITWYTAFSYLGVARNAWVVCEGRQKYLKYVYASAALSNVVLNLMFIPLWGASGAALASLAAQIVTTMVAPFFIKGLRENSVMMVQAILLKFS